MKTNEILHLPKDPILMIRKSYIDICNGDKHSAILLSYLEYWDKIKKEQNFKNAHLNEIAIINGFEPTQDTSELQYHTDNEIYEQCLGFISKKGITKAKKHLSELGFITLHKNPNPKYTFDNTTFYELNIAKINQSLQDLYSSGNKTNDSVNLTQSTTQNDALTTSKWSNGSSKTTQTITEITTETSPEITKEYMREKKETLREYKKEEKEVLKDNMKEKREILKDNKKVSRERGTFVPPAQQEWTEYFISIVKNRLNGEYDDLVTKAQAEVSYLYYEQNDWKVKVGGKYRKMKNWKLAIQQWILKDIRKFRKYVGFQSKQNPNLIRDNDPDDIIPF